MTTQTPTPIKSNHALLLNRLAEMQRASYYATAKDELGMAEKAIVHLEAALSTATAKIAELEGEIGVLKIDVANERKTHVGTRHNANKLRHDLADERTAREEAEIDQCNWVAKAGIFQMKLVDAEQGRQAYRDLVHAMDVQATKLTHMEGDEEIIYGYQFNTGLFHALLGLLAGANHG